MPSSPLFKSRGMRAADLVARYRRLARTMSLVATRLAGQSWPASEDQELKQRIARFKKCAVNFKNVLAGISGSLSEGACVFMFLDEKELCRSLANCFSRAYLFRDLPLKQAVLHSPIREFVLIRQFIFPRYIISHGLFRCIAECLDTASVDRRILEGLQDLADCLDSLRKAPLFYPCPTDESVPHVVLNHSIEEMYGLCDGSLSELSTMAGRRRVRAYYLTRLRSFLVRVRRRYRTLSSDEHRYFPRIDAAVGTMIATAEPWLSAAIDVLPDFPKLLERMRDQLDYCNLVISETLCKMSLPLLPSLRRAHLPEDADDGPKTDVAPAADADAHDVEAISAKETNGLYPKLTACLDDIGLVCSRTPAVVELIRYFAPQDSFLDRYFLFLMRSYHEVANLRALGFWSYNVSHVGEGPVRLLIEYIYRNMNSFNRRVHYVAFFCFSNGDCSDTWDAIASLDTEPLFQQLLSIFVFQLRVHARLPGIEEVIATAVHSLYGFDAKDFERISDFADADIARSFFETVCDDAMTPFLPRFILTELGAMRKAFGEGRLNLTVQLLPWIFTNWVVVSSSFASRLQFQFPDGAPLCSLRPANRRDSPSPTAEEADAAIFVSPARPTAKKNLRTRTIRIFDFEQSSVRKLHRRKLSIEMRQTAVGVACFDEGGQGASQFCCCVHVED